eukprot:TRINITY_DN7500_c0_g1_i14.p1 TRINITY_DN7500_c0_g1~~TRINITY_DN7500_c0_g1_i14.p1  ORF type:complete len:453 (+),score=81.14 TRINITY_DN7500_c0_g1_i14:44-1402(+)
MFFKPETEGEEAPPVKKKTIKKKAADTSKLSGIPEDAEGVPPDSKRAPPHPGEIPEDPNRMLNNPLFAAYKPRLTKISQLIWSALLPKRDQLIAQIHRIDYRNEEIKYVKTIIERDARAEYGGIIERLRYAEGVKLAILNHEIGELQKDIERISEIINNFNELASGQVVDPANFMARFQIINENLEYMIAKPFKVTIDVVPHDLPRELTEIRHHLQRYRASQALLDFKDEVIYRLSKNAKLSTREAIEELEKTSSAEMAEWAKLTDKFAAQLKKYQLICFYCGSVLDDGTVNAKCKVNNVQAVPDDFKGYTQEVPAKSYHGNVRHYFAKPREELFRTYYDPEAKDKIAFKTPFHITIELILSKLRKFISDNRVDLHKVFLDHDKNKLGTVNSIIFSFIAFEILRLDQGEITQLSRFLDPAGTNSINYIELEKLIADPKYFESIPIREFGANE